MKGEYTKQQNILVIARAQAIEKEGNIFLQQLDGEYLDGIADGYQKMTLIIPVHKKGKDKSYSYFQHFSYQILSKNIRIVEVNDYKDRNYNFISAINRLPKQFSTIANYIHKHDAVFVMMPTYRAVFGALLGKLFRKKVFVYSGNDWKQDLSLSFKWQGWSGQLFRRPYIMLSAIAEAIAMGSADVRFLNGYTLHEKYSRLNGITEATKPVIGIKVNDLYFREDTCLGEKIKILCVANVTQRKGIEYLIQGISEISTDSPEIELKIIGDINHNYAQHMIERCKTLNLDQIIRFEGYVENGPQLIQHYQKSDIFILPSLSEGFPRVIFESMSQSLPIITTNIPNIYNRISKNNLAYFVPTKDSTAIAKAVEEIIQNQALRKQYISNGYQYIQEIIIGEKASEQFLRVANCNA